MERRLREHGGATRNKARSAGRPSELSERLERLVRCATERGNTGAISPPFAVISHPD